MACKAAHLDLIHALSKDTWGLVVSFEDSLTNPVAQLDRALHSARRKGEEDQELIFKTTRQPLRILNFLTALYDKIIAANLEDENLVTASALTGSNANKSRDKKKFKTVQYKIGKFGKHLARLTDTVKGLSALGLTQCYMNPASIHKLDNLIDLLKSSLTDLDLSFAYMGLKGAQLLSSVLADQECQVINLNLKGNVFGDPGAVLLSQGLKVQNIYDLNTN